MGGKRSSLPRRKFGRKSVALVTASALALTGCATQTQRIGADNGSDACYANLKALDATGDYFGNAILAGAAVGALGGALLGGLIGGNLKSAAIGAGAGAAVGAAGGYYQAKQQQAKDKSVLYASVMNDYDKELGKIDEAQLAFKQLVACRNGQLRLVAADYKAKRISRDEAKARWKRILDQKAHDLQIAQNMGKDMTKHISEFENASNQMSQTPWDAEQQAQLAKEEQELRRKQAQDQQALNATYTAKKNDLAKQTMNAKDKADARKNIDSEYSQEKKDQETTHHEELVALQQKKAGKIPTSTAQTHIQSYNQNVASAQQGYNAQVATAENPDGFEAAAGPATGELLPGQGLVRIFAFEPRLMSAIWPAPSSAAPGGTTRADRYFGDVDGSLALR